MTAYLAGLVFLRAEEDGRAVELDVTMLCVLAAMASFAGESAVPECYASQASIARRAHVKRRTLQYALPSLVKSGLIEHGGTRGKTVRWLLPFLCAPDAHKSPESIGAPGAHKTSAPGAHKTSAPGAHNPSESPESLPISRKRNGAQSRLATLGATDDEIKILIEKIRTENRPRNLDAYVAALADSGDLARLLDEVRASNRRVDLSERLAELRLMPACEHGAPGGDQLHPTGGEPLCITCRFQRRRNA